jgi:molybdopterin converting factor small subunit
MASIKVRFYSLWRTYLKLDEIALQAGTLSDALGQIDERFGSQLREKLGAKGIHLEGMVQDYSLILLNGTNLRNLKTQRLKEGDVLHVFPPSMGG